MFLSRYYPEMPTRKLANRTPGFMGNPSGIPCWGTKDENAMSPLNAFYLKRRRCPGWSNIYDKWFAGEMFREHNTKVLPVDKGNYTWVLR